jgi:hypothetical protein
MLRFMVRTKRLSMLMSQKEAAMLGALVERAELPMSSVMRDLIFDAYRTKFGEVKAVCTRTNSYVWRQRGDDWFLTSPLHDTLWFARLTCVDKTLNLFKVVQASTEVPVKTASELAQMIGLTVKS